MLAETTLWAQTDGTARLEATIRDYTGTSGTRHWTVVWVTTSAGAFIKTLRLQGPSITTTHWNSHCGQWYSAKAGGTALDGYTSATAASYTGTNSPIILTWNCRNANNALVPDGTYKFWIQYAEDSGQGPYTTSGLLWTKGSTGATNTYADQGANFASMRVAWNPAPATVAPTIISAAPAASGTVGVDYSFTCTASGTAPITFSASGLPTGLKIDSSGVISGTPTTEGLFNGTITAANGTPPNATQPFSLLVNVVPASISAFWMDGAALVLTGHGPPSGTYSVLVSPSPSQTPGNWTPIATNTFDASGHFAFTNSIAGNSPQQFYLLKVP